MQELIMIGVKRFKLLIVDMLNPPCIFHHVSLGSQDTDMCEKTAVYKID